MSLRPAQCHRHLHNIKAFDVVLWPEASFTKLKFCSRRSKPKRANKEYHDIEDIMVILYFFYYYYLSLSYQIG